jgi:Na+/phosphate symporter
MEEIFVNNTYDNGPRWRATRDDWLDSKFKLLEKLLEKLDDKVIKELVDLKSKVEELETKLEDYDFDSYDNRIEELEQEMEGKAESDLLEEVESNLDELLNTLRNV